MKKEQFICDLCDNSVEGDVVYPNGMHIVDVRIDFGSLKRFDICDKCFAKYKGPSLLDKMLALFFGKGKA